MCMRHEIPSRWIYCPECEVWDETVHWIGLKKWCGNAIERTHARTHTRTHSHTHTHTHTHFSSSEWQANSRMSILYLMFRMAVLVTGCWALSNYLMNKLTTWPSTNTALVFNTLHHNWPDAASSWPKFAPTGLCYFKIVTLNISLSLPAVASPWALGHPQEQYIHQTMRKGSIAVLAFPHVVFVFYTIALA